MADYISREVAIDAVNVGNLHRGIINALQAIISDIPSADVVEVVRCKDCKWCHSGFCERFDDLIPLGLNTIEWENWFCADGEKRANNG